MTMPGAFDWVLREEPEAAAAAVAAAANDRPDWLASFARELLGRQHQRDLASILAAWDLSRSDAARIFGVSRQAVSKWLAHGIPADRVEAVGDLAAATDVLERHLKLGRLPVVVRRRADALGNRSLLELAATDGTRAVLDAAHAMFDFGDLHA